MGSVFLGHPVIIICAFGTVTKGMIQGLEDLEIRWRFGTIQIINSQIKKPHLQIIPIKDNFKVYCLYLLFYIYK